MVKGLLLDASGQPLETAEYQQQLQLQGMLANQKKELFRLMQERRSIRAKFDAAQTFTGNENHWGNADNLDPHEVASWAVRQKLRSRSRYEIIENNPYLKGTILTIVNDFVGSGPSLIITDDRISDKRKQSIQDRWAEWFEIRKIRQKLWRMRMAKIVDGESFAMPYINRNGLLPYDVLMDFYVIEADRISSTEALKPDPNATYGEVDGVRFDKFENPLFYHLLYQHPGGASTSYPFTELLVGDKQGTWIPAKFMIHWFRQDRGWIRGIPETTPSLPLCALLRRYTLSIVRHAEVVSDITVLLETQNPASPTSFSSTNPVDDPFNIFPIEMGLMMNLPFGYQMKQLEPVPLGTQYDEFVGSILREITRPLLSPYNMVAGTSKDSNMASAVVDQNIYKGGQESERFACEENVLEHMALLWWNEASLIRDFFGPTLGELDPFRRVLPKHEWNWPKIGLDHTDPSKVATAIQILHAMRVMTDGDIQKTYFNRDLNSWQQQVLADDKFRQKIKPAAPEDNPENMPKPAPAAGPGKSNGKPASNGSARK